MNAQLPDGHHIPFAITPNGHLMETIPPHMTTPPQADASQPLARLAAQPEVDECDVAEEAMPAMVFGDLRPADVDWVNGHVATCAYCANVLESFEQCDSALECCNQPFAAVAQGEPQRSAASILGLREARYGFMDSPVGPLLVAASDEGVCEISYLVNHDRQETLREIESRGILAYERQASVDPVVHELGDYFNGERDRFGSRVDLFGLTEFTRKVLKATVHVPYGGVTTYGEIARLIGQPSASRAVGNALGRNPVPVIVPCHRIIRSSGDMGWYTGGAQIKQALLGIEGVSVAPKATATQGSLRI